MQTRAKELFNVLTPPDAYARLRPYLPVGQDAELVPTDQALGRVLASTLHAPAELPSFARSTMDGYAVRAADTYGASEGLPAYLSIVGEVLMGRQAEVRVAIGQCAVIATGGMLPPGADAVVMVEQTQPVDADTIEVVRPVAPGENVIQPGEDVRTGDLLLEAGHLVRPQDIGGLLALGIVTVRVASRLRVAILGSGDEIVPPDQEPGPGQVRDINSYTLGSLVRRAGHQPLLFGIVPDVYEVLESVARRAIESADVVIISAGSSVSTRDLTAQAIQALGEPGVLVHGVSLKPGKPTILAAAQGKPVFGLPGNPVSCMVTFDLFVWPALFEMSGCQVPPPRSTVTARLTKNVASAPGREDYFQVRLIERDGARWAEPLFGKSNLIYTLIRADGLVKIDLDIGGLSAGHIVEVRLF
ncbi:MAG: molybdopterin molybdotransferase MoeA [Chloroflexi bacterium]|nr:molybdopterin molybdotransferase MoeA [Chloroflexota bacterium]